MLSTEQTYDSDGSERPSKRSTGRRKIKIEFIEDKNRRHITFSKRKAGIMKKAYELATLTGTQLLLLVVSETGLVYTFTTTKLQPIVTQPEGKNLIQACLNSPDPKSESLPASLPETASPLPSMHAGILDQRDFPKPQIQRPHHAYQPQIPVSPCTFPPENPYYTPNSFGNTNKH